MSEEMPERFIMDVRTGVHNIENPDLYTWHQVCRVKSAEGLPGTYTPVFVQSLEELKNVLRELIVCGVASEVRPDDQVHELKQLLEHLNHYTMQDVRALPKVTDPVDLEAS